MAGQVELDLGLGVAAAAVSGGPLEITGSRMGHLWEVKARAVAGLKAYITYIEDPSAEFVIGAYHQLWHVETSFRIFKHDLQARPIYHHKRESTEAHLNIVFAALAITRLIENRTGWSIKKFVRTTRR